MLLWFKNICLKCENDVLGSDVQLSENTLCVMKFEIIYFVLNFWFDSEKRDKQKRNLEIF